MKKVKRWIKWGLVLGLLALFIPYLVSRFQAPASRLQLFSGTPTPQQDHGILRIACYNIAHGRGLAKSNWSGGDAPTRRDRLDEIATLLDEIDADIVVLNEVDFDASWSNNVNQAEYLASKCGYPHRVEQRNLDFRILHRTWRFGNAVLSKFPLSGAQLIDLPSYNDLETALAGKKRSFGVDVQIGEQQVHVVAAHLSHRSEELRERSAGTIVNHVRNRDLPCVLAGDMNSSPNFLAGIESDQRIANWGSKDDGITALDRLLFHSKLFHSYQNPEFPEPTFPADAPRIVIDWILATEDLEMPSCEPVNSTLSDHLPVVAEILLKPKTDTELE